MSRRVPHNVLPWWLTLALLLAPPPSWAFAPDPGNAPCHEQSLNGASGGQPEAMPGCPHCRQDGCQNGDCGDTGCVLSHATASLPAPHRQDIRAARHSFHRPSLNTPHSIAPVPLLRPPV